MHLVIRPAYRTALGNATSQSPTPIAPTDEVAGEALNNTSMRRHFPQKINALRRFPDTLPCFSTQKRLLNVVEKFFYYHY
jgi:hypothetical protein